MRTPNLNCPHKKLEKYLDKIFLKLEIEMSHFSKYLEVACFDLTRISKITLDFYEIDLDFWSLKLGPKILQKFPGFRNPNFQNPEVPRF